MKKFLLTSFSLLALSFCIDVKKSSTNEATLLLLAQPATYQVSANISTTSATSNAMVYFSPATTTTSASVREASSTTTTSTNSTTSTTTGPVFTTSAQTDTNGNVVFTLAVGEYQAVVTTTDNKGMAFKIKIESGSSLGLNKDGKATITYSDGSIKVVIIRVSGNILNAIPNAPISFVCGYNPKGDTAAPELTSVSIDSSTVDVSSGSGKLRISAKVSDGYEGTSSDKRATGVKSVTAKLFSPKRITGSGYTAHATLTLNANTGFYEGDATLTNFVDNGTWNVGLITARDVTGNERQYLYDSSKSTTNYTFTGCGQKIDSKITIPTFTVKGSSPDTAAPTLGTVTLKSDINSGATVQNPIASNVDISVSSASPKEVVITVTVTGATDTGGTGNASGIAYMDARLNSYSWWSANSNYLGNAIYIRLDLTSGTNTNGTYSGSATIRQFAEGNTAPDGQWFLGGIWVTDKAGNSLWTSRTTLNKSFTIIGASTTATADFYPPELKSISINKTDVNFDQSFTISADVADGTTETTSADQNATTSSTTLTTNNSSTNASGVKAVNIVLYSPLKLLDNTLGTTKTLSTTYNTSTLKYEATGTFPTASNEEGGTWKVGWVEVVDKAGNYRVYRLSEGYTYYTYVKLTRVDGDVSGSFIVTNISPVAITRN